MSRLVFIGGWTGVIGASGIYFQSLLYNHNVKIRKMLVQDNPNSEIIKEYDKWLDSGVIYQILNDPREKKTSKS